MAEMREQMEQTEQNMSSEEIKQLRDYYREAYYEATGEMKEYYKQKAEEAQAAFSEALKEEGVAKKEKNREEWEAREKEFREWKNVQIYGTPAARARYAAQKEYAQNGESYRFKELNENVAREELKEKYPELYK